MKKKVLVIIAGIVLAVSIAACGNSSTAVGSEENTNIMERLGYYGDIEEYRDTETRVHYFVYDRKSGYGGMGGICPRYNADGTLYVD